MLRDAGTMLGRPTGTVTFLFTDVEGSTRLWEEAPAEMRVALEGHDQIVREAIESRGGYVFSTAGDEFAAAFGNPADALNAALAAQVDLSLLVRMGVHTGTAQERGGDFLDRR